MRPRSTSPSRAKEVIDSGSSKPYSTRRLASDRVLLPVAVQSHCAV